MYRAVEGFVTGASEAFGELTAALKKKSCFSAQQFLLCLIIVYCCSLPHTDTGTFGEGSCPGVNAETPERTDGCHRAAAPEDYCSAERYAFTHTLCKK